MGKLLRKFLGFLILVFLLCLDILFREFLLQMVLTLYLMMGLMLCLLLCLIFHFHCFGLNYLVLFLFGIFVLKGECHLFLFQFLLLFFLLFFHFCFLSFLLSFYLGNFYSLLNLYLFLIQMLQINLHYPC